MDIGITLGQSEWHRPAYVTTIIIDTLAPNRLQAISTHRADTIVIVGSRIMRQKYRCNHQIMFRKRRRSAFRWFPCYYSHSGHALWLTALRQCICRPLAILRFALIITVRWIWVTSENLLRKWTPNLQRDGSWCWYKLISSLKWTLVLTHWCWEIRL